MEELLIRSFEFIQQLFSLPFDFMTRRDASLSAENITFGPAADVLSAEEKEFTVKCCAISFMIVRTK